MITIQSYAKINLGLQVLSRLPSGYHEIESIFQTVSLWDDLQVTEHAGKAAIQLTCTNPAIPTGKENILTTVWEAIQPPFGLHIHIVKRIPVGGGLGGGSSNAASLIQYLGTRLNIPFHEQVNIAKKIGADVPFFLYGGTARVTGIGEKIMPIAPTRWRWFVLINPGIFISTPQVFGAWDKNPDPVPGDNSDVLFNALKGPCWRLVPEMAELERSLLAMGVGPVALSGSGATVYMPVPSQAQAEDYAQKLRSVYPDYWISVVEPITIERFN